MKYTASKQWQYVLNSVSDLTSDHPAYDPLWIAIRDAGAFNLSPSMLTDPQIIALGDACRAIREMFA